MKRAILMAVLAAPLPARGAEPASEPEKPAAEAPAPSAAENLMEWLRNWKQGLERSAVERRYRRVRTTAVAAVRGSDQRAEDPAKPYWKSPWARKKEARRRKEREELMAAVDLALSGDREGALKSLDEFEKNHPKSDLLPEVREARERIGALEPPAPAPEPAAK